MDNIVVDFVGVILEDQFIIKEFAIARISGNSIKLDYESLINTTELPYTSEELSDNLDFKNFMERTKIDWSRRTDNTLDGLKAKFESLRHHNIFVRDITNVIMLHFKLGVKEPIMTLAKLGFDPNEEVIKTNCANHYSSDSYCAKDNAMNMAKWLNENFKKPSTIKNRFVAINFTRIYSHGVRTIKKLRVHCFDNQGTVIVNKLITPVLPSSIKVNDKNMNNYVGHYQERFRIKYNDPNLLASAIRSELKKILLKNKIEFIFVIGSTPKRVLLELIGPLFNVIDVEEYGFNTMTYSLDSLDDAMLEYNFESHEKEVLKMVNWVLQKNIYLAIREEYDD